MRPDPTVPVACVVVQAGFREISASELRLELEDSEAAQQLPITVIDVRNTVQHATG